MVEVDALRAQILQRRGQRQRGFVGPACVAGASHRAIGVAEPRVQRALHAPDAVGQRYLVGDVETLLEGRGCRRGIGAHQQAAAEPLADCGARVARGFTEPGERRLEGGARAVDIPVLQQRLRPVRLLEIPGLRVLDFRLGLRWSAGGKPRQRACERPAVLGLRHRMPNASSPEPLARPHLRCRRSGGRCRLLTPPKVNVLGPQ